MESNTRQLSSPVDPNRMTVLVVEDDASLREVLEMGLEDEGLRVVLAADGKSGVEQFESARPQIVLLDIMLPGMDGIEVCREIRKRSAVPVIMLTARTSTVDVVVGLEAGADDYVTKPFQFPELIARIRAALRRAGPTAGTALARTRAMGDDPVDKDSEEDTAREMIVFGPLRIDVAGYGVYRDGVELSLTATEFRVLLELVRHRGQVLSREQLLDRVWQYEFLGDSRLVDVHVQRLRRKIETDAGRPRLILTVRGAGYKAAAEPE